MVGEACAVISPDRLRPSTVTSTPGSDFSSSCSSRVGNGARPIPGASALEEVGPSARTFSACFCTVADLTPQSGARA
jgi:hypothetical protein